MTNAALKGVSFGSAETCSICTDLRPDLVIEGLVHLADGYLHVIRRQHEDVHH